MKLEQPHDAARAHLNEVNRGAGNYDYLQLLLRAAAEDSDRKAETSQRLVRTAWRVTACAATGALVALAIAAGAVATALQPAPPPQVLVVERATGKVEPLVSLSTYQLTPEEATIRRNTATFLRARESYSADTAQDNYYDAAAFMSPPLRTQWESYWDINNPASPLNVYKRDGKVRPEIGAITILRNNKGVATGARVTFTRTITRGGQPAGQPTAWIATIAFHWVDAPTSERQRRVNDLGWEVTTYDADPDVGVVSKPAVPVPSPAAPVAAAEVATRQVTP